MTTINTPAVDLAQLSKEVSSVTYLALMGKGKRVSEETIAHVSQIVNVTDKFYNVDAIDLNVVNEFIDGVIKTPEVLMAGSVVTDGTICPTGTTEERATTIDYMSNLSKHEGEAGAASVAFLMQGVLHAMHELNK